MSEFAPVGFADVRLEGNFWRERLDTVLARTIPSQHVQLEKHGILESLTLPNFTKDEVTELYGQHTADTGQRLQVRGKDYTYHASV